MTRKQQPSKIIKKQVTDGNHGFFIALTEEVKIHICAESPCSVQDKELAECLLAGLGTTYTNKDD